MYVNNQMATEYISPGVATFDALNNYNYIYDHATTESGIADYLTSAPIPLKSKDSLYLSFFYQAMGLGEQPDLEDSLVAQVKFNDSVWVTVWHQQGIKMDTFVQAIVPLSDTLFPSDTLVFRFYNRISLVKQPANKGLTGNVDHWHIDFVSVGRVASEASLQALNDVTFRDSPGSIFSGYRQMPASHIAPDTRYNRNIVYSLYNYFNEAASTTITYDVYFDDVKYDQEPVVIPSPTFDMGPLSGVDISLTFKPEIILSEDLTNFNKLIIKYYVSDVDVAYTDKSKIMNDTIVQVYDLSTYYAYDDGMPEKSYGFFGNAADAAQFAQLFEVAKPGGDKLTYIGMYFNPVADTLTVGSPYVLALWKAIDGNNTVMPAEFPFWQSEELKVTYDNYGKFYYYQLKEPIDVSDKVYIGWQQQYGSGYLNIGLDKNNTNNNGARINTNGSWQPSSVTDAIMIRAGFGQVPTGMATALKQNNDGILYPNPVKSSFSIKGLTLAGASYFVFDLSGRLVHQDMLTVHNDLPAFVNNGLYVLKVVKDNTHYTYKMQVLR
ncbi:MAG: T9SS type A sorting domain-containing protein [Bacteroidales bacterium]|nr:T9SS type A sorting domain-containing protein [Bacteroidales bacterium]